MSEQNTNLPVKQKTIQSILSSEAVKNRLQETLGKGSGAFATSILNVANASPALQKCDPMTVIKAAMIAAALNLPVDSNLGFSAIIPYKNKGVDEAQFQIMYKGFIQLAIRSGAYETINVSEVYEDELREYNPFTGDVYFTPSSEWKMRTSVSGNVIGYYAFFRLLTGFKKSVYMSVAEVEKHATTYSQSYRYDKSKGYKSSKWSTDFDAMGKKTVLKLLLSKYGVMSVEMQTAIQFDQSKVDGTIDNPIPLHEDNTSKVQIEAPSMFDMTAEDLEGTPFQEDK